MTLALYEQGLFTWAEWAATLSAAIKHAQAAEECDDGSTYYQHWLTAIEQLVSDKGITTRQALAERRGAWDRAAHATPHGQPILLENDTLRGSANHEVMRGNDFPSVETACSEALRASQDLEGVFAARGEDPREPRPRGRE